jgi:hypothetical protein
MLAPERRYLLVADVAFLGESADFPACASGTDGQP